MKYLFLVLLAFLSLNVFYKKVEEKNALKVIAKIIKSESKHNFKLDKNWSFGANCVSAKWTHSDNIYAHYGGNNWTAFKAIGSGTGWMRASCTINGITYASTKKYVTCIP